jgi:hypothetical protein
MIIRRLVRPRIIPAMLIVSRKHDWAGAAEGGWSQERSVENRRQS